MLLLAQQGGLPASSLPSPRTPVAVSLVRLSGLGRGGPVTCSSLPLLLSLPLAPAPCILLPVAATSLLPAAGFSAPPALWMGLKPTFPWPSVGVVSLRAEQSSFRPGHVLGRCLHLRDWLRVKGPSLTLSTGARCGGHELQQSHDDPFRKGTWTWWARGFLSERCGLLGGPRSSAERCPPGAVVPGHQNQEK